MRRSNLQSFCRTCLENLESISSNYHINQTPNLAKLLIIYTSLNIKDDDGDIYPQKLCGKCYDNVQQFRVFREMAQQSEEMLRKIVEEDIDEDFGAENNETKCFTECCDTTIDDGESSMVLAGAESFLDPLLQTESNSNNECEVPVKKKKMKSISWTFVKEFENRIEAEEALKEENTWSLNYSNHTIEGQKRFFRCNKVKKRGIQCAAKMYLLYDSTSNAVFMYRADADHDHENKNLSSWSTMNDVVKLEIKKLFDRNMKPRFIINNLARIDGIQMPKMCQIRSYVRDLRRARYTECNVSSAEIEQLKINTNSESIEKIYADGNPISETDSNPKEVIPPRKKKKKEPISWSFVKTFLSYSEAEEVLKEENTWSIEYSHNTDEGQKIFFRCNKLKKRGQCSAKVYLLLDPASDSVSFYRADADHDHENKSPTSKHGLSEYVKLEINKLYYSHQDMRPKDILDCLSRINGIKLPNISQLSNYLRDLREEIRHINMLPDCSTSSIGVNFFNRNQRGNNIMETSDIDNSTTNSVEIKRVVNPESGIMEAIREKKWKPIPWVLDRKCANINEAEEVLRGENTWSIDYNRSTEEGHKKFYRCNKVKRRAIQCSAKVYLLFDSFSDSVSIYRADAEHDHDQKELNSSYGLSEDIKLEINKLYELDMKPRDIFEKLSQVGGIKMPKISQIRNYISDRRRRSIGYLNESSVSTEIVFRTEFVQPSSSLSTVPTQQNLETDKIISENKILQGRDEYFE